MLDIIGIGQLVHGQNLNHVLSTPKVLHFKFKHILMCDLECIYISGCIWAHMWVQCNISIMSLNTRFAKLMDGFTCIFEVFTDVCYVFSSKMMILGPIVDSIDANGAFKLLGVTFQWSRLIAWAYIDL